MIVVLKYSIRSNKEINEILEKFKLKFSFTLNETEITNASHIILPDTFNLNTAIRKMQLMNLYSILRMMKKPILGINNGFSLMCNDLADIQKLGLGLFPINSKTCSINENNKNKVGKVRIIKETKFLHQITTKTVKCNLERSVDVNDFTTSIISSNTQQFSLTCENKNYYSIQIEISKNKKIFERLIGNFVNL